MLKNIQGLTSVDITQLNILILTYGDMIVMIVIALYLEKEKNAYIGIARLNVKMARRDYVYRDVIDVLGGGYYNKR